MKNYLLGIDNGGTVAKAGLFDLQGRELATAGRKTPMSSPAPGHTERDAESLWQATAEAVREVIERAGAAPGQIACVATAGHGNGLYLVDGDGQPVRPGIVSTDTRAADYVARWNAEGVADAVRPKTMQSLWPGQPNALLAWLQDNEPESLRRAAWALMCKDFIRAKLTGEFFSEETDASATSLMDVGTGRYDDDLLAACGIAGLARLLPPVRRADAICGQVTPRAAGQTGLRAGTPVAGGLFDADACGLAAGIVDERQLQIIAGTSNACCGSATSRTRSAWPGAPRAAARGVRRSQTHSRRRSRYPPEPNWERWARPFWPVLPRAASTTMPRPFTPWFTSSTYAIPARNRDPFTTRSSRATRRY